jgi:hypothetical protein
MNSIPKPYLIIYLGFSTLLNILGLASIADGIIVWSGYIAEIIKVYHQFLRDPILLVILSFWPVGWPKFPGWAVDILIVQSSFFLSYRLFIAFEKSQYLVTYQRVHPLLIFVGGPLVPFFQLIRLYRKGGVETEQAYFEAEEGEAAEAQYLQYGSTNLPLLSNEGWHQLEKRQHAGLEAQEAVKATFIKLNLYYLCYFVLVIVLLFVGYQFGELHHH